MNRLLSEAARARVRDTVAAMLEDPCAEVHIRDYPTDATPPGAEYAQWKSGWRVLTITVPPPRP